jgi:hypothetical protein
LKAPCSYYSPRTSAIHGPNPKEGTEPETWHRIVLTNPVRCCSAFAYTPISPPSLDSRCSAFGCALGAPFNGQSVDTGQAAASIHRMHHSNERCVGGSKIGHAEEHVSAACTALSPCYLLPSDAFSRHKLLAPGPPTCYQCPSRPPPAKERGKTAQKSPRKPCGSRWNCSKSKLAF